MRFSFHANKQELGAVTVSHLWSGVYGLSRHAAETPLPLEKWLELYQQGIFYARHKGAAQLMHRLEEVGNYADLSRRLPDFHFVRKCRRIEFRRPLAELPGDDGTPFDWRHAGTLGWPPEKIAGFAQSVAEGDPSHDPNEDPVDFIQDWLKDTVLTCGPEVIWVGHIAGTPAALVVAQVNPKSGWSRLSYMGIAPGFRGKGLGKWVHRKGFAELRRQGGVLYHGGTASDNAPMLKLFEAHGCPVYVKMEEWALDLTS